MYCQSYKPIMEWRWHEKENYKNVYVIVLRDQKILYCRKVVRSKLFLFLQVMFSNSLKLLMKAEIPFVREVLLISMLFNSPLIIIHPVCKLTSWWVRRLPQLCIIGHIVEGRPTASGMIFRLRCEQLFPAHKAVVGAGLVVVVEFVGKRSKIVLCI